MPQGAKFLYDLNFFCGFIVASGSYWVLCRLFPIPATSDRWMEVGDEIMDVRVAYARSEDEESATGSEYVKRAGDGAGAGFRERNVRDGY